MPNWNVEIDIGNIPKSMRLIDGIGNAIIQGLKDGTKELLRLTREKLFENLTLYNLGRSRIASGVSDAYLKDGWRIDVFAPNSEGEDFAKYVEFGTGKVGKDGIPHPDANLFNWIYDINEHGEDGWFYPDDDGGIGWTMGQEARPFMFLTSNWLNENAKPILEKNIETSINRLLLKG